MLNDVGKWVDFWMQGCMFFIPNMKEQNPKVTPANATWKVTRKAEKSMVFFSNAPTMEAAKKEADHHFGFCSDKVLTSWEIPFSEVEANPHKTQDEDGYDHLTGLKLPS